MTELIDRAIQKIDKEAESNGAFGTVIAQFIIDNLIYDDDSAEKILSEEKSLLSCIKEVGQKARSHSNRAGFAVVDESTVFSWVCDYFGTEAKKEKETAKISPQSLNKKSGIINVDFDSFM